MEKVTKVAIYKIFLEFMHFHFSTLKLFLSYAHNYLHLFSFLHILFHYYTEKIINNREIFLYVFFIEKFPHLLFVHNRHQIIFCLNIDVKAKNPIINFYYCTKHLIVNKF